MPPISWSRRWNGPRAGCWTPNTSRSSRTALFRNSTSHLAARFSTLHARDRRAVVVAVASVRPDAFELVELDLVEEEVWDDPLLLTRASAQVIFDLPHVRLAQRTCEGPENLNLDGHARLPALASQEVLDLPGRGRS